MLINNQDELFQWVSAPDFTDEFLRRCMWAAHLLSNFPNPYPLVIP